MVESSASPPLYAFMSEYLDANGLNTYHQGVKTLLDGKQDLVNNAECHNTIYRGKYLGTSVTQEQYATIEAGEFEDLYLGDYWTIGGHNWRIWDFDWAYQCEKYYSGGGQNVCPGHHIVVMCDDCYMKGSDYNGSFIYDTDAELSGGFINTKFYQNILDPMAEEIYPLFGGKQHFVLHNRAVLSSVNTSDPDANPSVNVASYFLFIPSSFMISPLYLGNILIYQASQKLYIHRSLSLGSITTRHAFIRLGERSFEEYWTSSLANNTSVLAIGSARTNNYMPSKYASNLGIRPYFLLGEDLSDRDDSESNNTKGRLLKATPGSYGAVYCSEEELEL